MESLKEEKDEGEDIIALKPVYVSLYGLSSASQLCGFMRNMSARA